METEVLQRYQDHTIVKTETEDLPPNVERVKLKTNGLFDRIKQALDCDKLPENMIFLGGIITPNLYDDRKDLISDLRAAGVNVLTYGDEPFGLTKEKFMRNIERQISLKIEERDEIEIEKLELSKEAIDLLNRLETEIRRGNERIEILGQLLKLVKDNFKNTALVFVTDNKGFSDIQNCVASQLGEAKNIAIMSTPRAEWKFPNLLGDSPLLVHKVEWEDSKLNAVKGEDRERLIKNLRVMLSPMDLVPTDAVRGLIHELGVDGADIGLEIEVYSQFTDFDATGAILSDIQQLEQLRNEWKKMDDGPKKASANYIIKRLWPKNKKENGFTDFASRPEIFTLTVLRLWCLDANCIESDLLDKAKIFIKTLLDEMTQKIEKEEEIDGNTTHLTTKDQPPQENPDIWIYFEKLHEYALDHPDFNPIFRKMYYLLAKKAIKDANAPGLKKEKRIGALAYATGLIQKAKEAGNETAELENLLPL